MNYASCTWSWLVNEVHMQNGTHKKAHGVVYSAVIVIKKTYYTNFLQNAVNRSKLYANCIRDVHDWRVLRAIYIYTIYTIMPSTIYIHNATSSSSIFVLSHGIYIYIYNKNCVYEGLMVAIPVYCALQHKCQLPFISLIELRTKISKNQDYHC